MPAIARHSLAILGLSPLVGMEVGIDGALATVRGPTKNPQRLRGFKFCWSWRSDLNRRPAVYETAALPTELRQQLDLIILCSAVAIQA